MKKTTLSFEDLMMWREALSSCAIEGNEWAKDMLKLRETDRNAYIKEITKLKIAK